jgi:hypothetical protein
MSKTWRQRYKEDLATLQDDVDRLKIQMQAHITGNEIRMEELEHTMWLEIQRVKAQKATFWGWFRGLFKP